MKKSIIHQTPAERLANTSVSTIAAIQQNTQAVVQAIRAIPQHDDTDELTLLATIAHKLDSNTEAVTKLQDYVDHPEIVVRKLDEVKSAALVTNRLLKALNDKEIPEQKEFPEIPKTDLTETNKLLYLDDGTEVSQHVTELNFGTNLTGTYDGNGRVTVNASGGAGSSWGGITGTLSNQTDLQTALDGKVTANTAIVGATKTKITYDAKGLVTTGADATTADIADSLNKRYITDAQQTVLTNTSGINTGDQTIALTGEATGSGTGSFAVTLTNSAVIGKVLTGLSLATSQVIAATDTIVQAFGYLQAQITALTTTVGTKVSSVGATAPITSSGGTAPTISTSMNTNKLIGRGTAGTGVMEEITLGTNLSLSGTTLNASVTGGGVTATTTEIDLGTIPVLSGKFSITTTGLTSSKPVIITQAVAPYTGKGTLADEAEMDSITVTGATTSTTNIDCYWTSPTYVKGNFKFNYIVSA